MSQQKFRNKLKERINELLKEKEEYAQQLKMMEEREVSSLVIENKQLRYEQNQLLLEKHKLQAKLRRYGGLTKNEKLIRDNKKLEIERTNLMNEIAMLRELIDKRQREYITIINGYKERVASLESQLTVMSCNYAEKFLEEQMSDEIPPLFGEAEVPFYDEI